MLRISPYYVGNASAWTMVYGMDSTVVTYESVLEAVMAGEPAEKIIPKVLKLSYSDGQTLLWTVCSIRDEIGVNSPEHEVELCQLLSSQCRFFIDARARCIR